MKAIRAGCGGVEAVYSSQAIFHPRFVPCLGARVTLHEKLTIKERFQYGPVTTFVDGLNTIGTGEMGQVNSAYQFLRN